MGRHGLNINAQGLSDDEVLSLCNPDVSTHLIFNNPQLAQRVYEKVGGVVISRGDWRPDRPDDTDTYPPELIGGWADSNTPDVFHYWANEPNPSNLSEFLSNTCEFMHMTADARVKLCLGNFAWPAILETSDVSNGLWDNFLRGAVPLSHTNQMVLGMHEYTMGALPGDVLPEPEQYGGQFDLSDESRWPTLSDIIDVRDSNWHLFRWVELTGRCIELGIGFPNMVVTECFWDAAPGEAGTQNLYDWCRTQLVKTLVALLISATCSNTGFPTHLR